jgi:predicted membrane metal-binding protein
MMGKKPRYVAIHERLSDDEHIQASSDRVFGFVFAVVFCLIGLWPLLSDGSVRWWAVAAAVVLFGVAMARPTLLAPFNRLWTRFGLLLNKITNPLIMGLLFYGIITPFGLIMRWAGKDPLRLRFDPSAESYWIEREPPGPAPETIKNQF